MNGKKQAFQIKKKRKKQQITITIRIKFNDKLFPSENDLSQIEYKKRCILFLYADVESSRCLKNIYTTVFLLFFFGWVCLWFTVTQSNIVKHTSSSMWTIKLLKHLSKWIELLSINGTNKKIINNKIQIKLQYMTHNKFTFDHYIWYEHFE